MASPQSGDAASATTMDLTGGGSRGSSISLRHGGAASPAPSLAVNVISEPPSHAHASSDTFTLMPFRAASPSSMHAHAAPVSLATHSSSRVPSASVSGPPSSHQPSSPRFHSLSLSAAPSSSSSGPTPSSRNNAASPFSASLSGSGGGIQAASTNKDELDRTPLLSQFDADDHSGASSLSAEALAKLHPLAAAAAAAGGGPAPVTSSSSYYDQYESTVHKIRARRAMELAAKEKAASPSPERSMHEFKVAATFLAFVTLVVALIIYFMYPRIPLWSIQKVDIDQMRLWRSAQRNTETHERTTNTLALAPGSLCALFSCFLISCLVACFLRVCFFSFSSFVSDGNANFAIHTSVDISNSNFMMTGIESIEVVVSHNGTSLGVAEVQGPLKFYARQTNRLSFGHDFSPVSPADFADVFDELSTTQGELTLVYDIAIVTSENFRLRNIQVHCTCKMQIDPTPVPPKAAILNAQCTHTEKTG